MPAVEARGEAAITLEGVSYGMRPSYEAIDEFETVTERSTAELYGFAAAKRLRAREIAAIVGACVRAKARQEQNHTVASFSDARIQEIISSEPGGLLGATQVLIGLLHKAATGGVTSTGEAKPAAMTSPSTPGDTADGSPASPPASSDGRRTPSGAARRTSSTPRSRRGTKPTPSSPEPAIGWTITLDGQDHALHVTLDALLAIELLTGKTLFAHVEDASARRVSLDDLATVLRCLLGPDCAVPTFAGPTWQHSDGSGLPPLLLPDTVGNRAMTAAIVRAGYVEVLALVMTPLLYAMRGGVTDAGDRKPGFELKG